VQTAERNTGRLDADGVEARTDGEQGGRIKEETKQLIGEWREPRVETFDDELTAQVYLVWTGRWDGVSRNGSDAHATAECGLAYCGLGRRARGRARHGPLDSARNGKSVRCPVVKGLYFISGLLVRKVIWSRASTDGSPRTRVTCQPYLDEHDKLYRSRSHESSALAKSFTIRERLHKSVLQGTPPPSVPVPSPRLAAPARKGGLQVPMYCHNPSATCSANRFACLAFRLQLRFGLLTSPCDAVLGAGTAGGREGVDWKEGVKRLEPETWALFGYAQHSPRARGVRVGMQSIQCVVLGCG
jgi:hypothetical protein